MPAVWCDGNFRFPARRGRVCSKPILGILDITMNAAVFLDRDNTIIHNDGDLGDPELVRLIQGAASAIASLRGLNYKIIVVTNQGGVARGKYTEADVEKTNQRVADLVKASSGANIDRFYYCPYHPNGTVPEYTQEHDWRKPAPGMLLQAARDMDIDLSQSWMIGDQMRDVQAGAAAGVRCILLRDDAQSLQPLRRDQLTYGSIETTGDIQHFTAKNLIEAVRIVAKQRKPEAERHLPLEDEPAARPKWDAAAVKAAREAKQQQADPPSAQAPAVDRPAAWPARAVSEPSSDAAAKPAAAQKPPARPSRTWNIPGSQLPGKPATATSKTETSADAAAASQTAAASQAGAASQTGAAGVSRQGGQVVAADVMEKAADEEGDDDASSLDASSPGRAAPMAEVTLRQILQELRGQRQVNQDFSYLRMCSVVLLIVAVFLLLAGLLLGGESLDSFLRWAATAVVLQLVAICLLLMEK